MKKLKSFSVAFALFATLFLSSINASAIPITFNAYIGPCLGMYVTIDIVFENGQWHPNGMISFGVYDPCDEEQRAPDGIGVPNEKGYQKLSHPKYDLSPEQLKDLMKNQPLISNQMHISPNPVKNDLNIKFGADAAGQSVKIDIADVKTGASLQQVDTILDSDGSCTIQVGQLRYGVYLIKSSINGKTVSVGSFAKE
ncbi:MAG: hypothetical protein EAZ57_05065 [Cytophagales bacterium]|nr:MAG: hypothetical protein EAZ67_00815 [Cytophagales bacterium]TAF61159.1 MAG: hypothetical protein EAZ57_05065 [Cytophagales bacterium]